MQFSQTFPFKDFLMLLELEGMRYGKARLENLGNCRNQRNYFLILLMEINTSMKENWHRIPFIELDLKNPQQEEIDLHKQVMQRNSHSIIKWYFQCSFELLFQGCIVIAVCQEHNLLLRHIIVSSDRRQLFMRHLNMVPFSLTMSQKQFEMDLSIGSLPTIFTSPDLRILKTSWEHKQSSASSQQIGTY